MTLKHRLETSMQADEGPFILEVGDSQSMESFQRKASMWLARDYIRLVVIISIFEYIDGNVDLLFLEYVKVHSVMDEHHFHLLSRLKLCSISSSKYNCSNH